MAVMGYLIAFLLGLMVMTSAWHIHDAAGIGMATSTPEVATSTAKVGVVEKPKEAVAKKEEKKVAAAPVSKPKPKITPQPTVTETKSVSATTSTTPPVTSPSPSLATQIQEKVLALTNAERAKDGLGALSSNAKLESAALFHSADMQNQDYFEHEDPQGCSASCRVSNAGYIWQRVGENIYTMTGYALNADSLAKMVVDGWMESPGHRANILTPQYTETGIGVSVQGKTVYVTAVYATPR